MILGNRFSPVAVPVASIMMVIILGSLLQAAYSNPRGELTRSFAGFTFRYPSEWRKISESNGTLVLLFGVGREEGVIVPRGGSVITISGSKGRDSLYENLRTGKSELDVEVIERKTLDISKVSAGDCKSVDVIRAQDTGLEPDSSLTYTYFTCLAKGQPLGLAVNQWLTDRNRDLILGTVIELFKSARLNLEGR